VLSQPLVSSITLPSASCAGNSGEKRAKRCPAARHEHGGPRSSHMYKTVHQKGRDHEFFRRREMKTSINLSFNGNCAEAIRFYERSLSGKILFELTWGESPLARDVPHTWAEKICHSTLMVADTTFHGVDLPPGTYEPPRGFSIVLDIDDVAGADHLFGVLGENGEVHVPLQETFWARRYAKVVDRFGIAWEISCGRAPAHS
jgi:PhnB protein